MKLESRALTIQTSTTPISPVKNGRGYMGIQNNDGANPIFLHLGPGAATLVNGVQIKAGEFYEVAPGFFHDEEVSAIAQTGAVAAVITEG